MKLPDTFDTDEATIFSPLCSPCVHVQVRYSLFKPTKMYLLKLLQLYLLARYFWMDLKMHFP